MARVQILALADMGGKQAQLAGGTPALAFQPCGGQAGFLGADLSDFSAPRLDLIGDALKEGCPLVARQGRIGPERRLCGLHGGIDMRGRANRKITRRAVGRGRAERRLTRHPFTRDQMFAVQHVFALRVPHSGRHDSEGPEMSRGCISVATQRWRL
jgi:hypothetical protein